MNPSPPKTSIRLRLVAAATCAAFFVGCATAPQTARGPEYAPTADMMREGRSASIPVEKRAADYLQAAAMTAPLLGSGVQKTQRGILTTVAAVKLPSCFAPAKEDNFG